MVANCDDDVCAFGEREQCPTSTACKPVGGTCVAPPPNRAPGAVCGGPRVGRCLAERTVSTAAACECNPGYLGDDCSRCAPGFVAAAAPASWAWGPAGAICLELPPPTFLGAPYVTTGVPDGEVEADVDSAGLGRWAVVGIALAVAALVGGAIAVFLVLAARQRDAERCHGEAAMMVNSPVYDAELTLTTPLRRLSDRVPRHSAPAVLDDAHCKSASLRESGSGVQSMPPASDHLMHGAPGKGVAAGVPIADDVEVRALNHALDLGLDTVTLTVPMSAGGTQGTVGSEALTLTVPMVGGEAYGGGGSSQAAGGAPGHVPQLAFFNPLAQSDQERALGEDTARSGAESTTAAMMSGGADGRSGSYVDEGMIERAFSNPLVETAASDMSSVADEAWRSMAPPTRDRDPASRPPSSSSRVSTADAARGSRGHTLDGSFRSDPWSLSDGSEAAAAPRRSGLAPPPVCVSMGLRSRASAPEPACSGEHGAADSESASRSSSSGTSDGVVKPAAAVVSGPTVVHPACSAAAPLSVPVVTVEFLTGRRQRDAEGWSEEGADDRSEADAEDGSGAERPSGSSEYFDAQQGSLSDADRHTRSDPGALPQPAGQPAVPRHARAVPRVHSDVSITQARLQVQLSHLRVCRVSLGMALGVSWRTAGAAMCFCRRLRLA